MLNSQLTKDYYIFETKTRYQNNSMLPFQEIKLNKNDLSPAVVKVMDPDRNALVTVEFSKVEFKASFEKGRFRYEEEYDTCADWAACHGGWQGYSFYC